MTEPPTFEQLLDNYVDVISDMHHLSFHSDFDAWGRKRDAAREALRSHVAELEKEIKGWIDIANSNRQAYESMLPHNQHRSLIDHSDPEVCRRLAEIEGASEVGIGFETIDPFETGEEEEDLPDD